MRYTTHVIGDKLLPLLLIAVSQRGKQVHKATHVHDCLLEAYMGGSAMQLCSYYCYNYQ